MEDQDVAQNPNPENPSAEEDVDLGETRQRQIDAGLRQLARRVVSASGSTTAVGLFASSPRKEYDGAAEEKDGEDGEGAERMNGDGPRRDES